MPDWSMVRRFVRGRWCMGSEAGRSRNRCRGVPVHRTAPGYRAPRKVCSRQVPLRFLTVSEFTPNWLSKSGGHCKVAYPLIGLLLDAQVSAFEVSESVPAERTKDGPRASLRMPAPRHHLTPLPETAILGMMVRTADSYNVRQDGYTRAKGSVQHVNLARQKEEKRGRGTALPTMGNASDLPQHTAELLPGGIRSRPCVAMVIAAA